MNFCPTCEMLEQLLHGELPEDQRCAIRTHLTCCVECQATLDRLSDAPESLRRAAECWPLPSASSHPPELARRLEELRRMPPLGLSSLRGADRRLETSLSFLGPPRHEGDLGAIGAYRILKELGRGGMGIVLLAYDEKLHRTVALKVLRPDRADATARARFVREARAAAGIEHDHVVTVYAVSNASDDPPYLIMQYVAGATLRDRIKAAERLDPHEAAQICRQAAAGLAAAHAAGLVHRDTKPANIILDAITNRAKIVDFGLVRLTAVPAATTQEGMLPGTPEYMSPEQVRAPSRIDGRSDVYSLGVTLYEALTGEVPFRGVPHLVLQQILHDEPRPPRQLNDRIPRDLETICLKAMAKEPDRRYQTAQELADDLERWLNGEPIRARAVRIVGKASRWCRRKPAIASLLTLLVLTIVGGFGGVIWQLRRAEAERGRAEASYRLAREGLEECVIMVADDPRLKSGPLEDLRRVILQAELGFFQKFLLLHGDEPAFQAERGRAYMRLGYDTQALASIEEAIAHYCQAVAIFTELVRRYPTVAAHQADLASSYANLAKLYDLTGKPKESEQALLDSLVLSRTLARQYPTVSAYQHVVASTCHNLGVLCFATGQWLRAEEALKDSLALWEVLSRDHPSVPEYPDALAASHLNLGNLYAAVGRTDEAEQAYRDALGLQSALVGNHPTVARYQAVLASTQINLGNLYMAIGRLDDAEQAYQESLELEKSLIAAHPLVAEHQDSAVATQNNLGNLYRATDRLREAEQAYQDSLALSEALVREHPTAASYRANLAASHNNLAILYTETNRPVAAEQAWQAALTVQMSLTRDCSTVPEYQANLAASYNNLAGLYVATGRFRDAELAHQDALAVQQVLARDYAGVPEYQATLAKIYTNLGTVYGTMGRLKEAEQAIQDAAAIQTVLTRDHADIPAYQDDLAASYNNLGDVYRTIGRPDEAEKACQNAVELWKNLVRDHPDIPKYQDRLAAGHANLGLLRLEHASTLIGMKEHARATAEAEALANAESASGDMLYNAACVYALATAAVGDDFEQAEQYATRAVELLHLALAKGFKDLAHMMQDVDLEPLRPRDDFRKLISGLAGTEGK